MTSLNPAALKQAQAKQSFYHAQRDAQLKAQGWLSPEDQMPFCMESAAAEWKAISELTYEERCMSVLIYSKQLIDEDFNPLGMAVGHFLDDCDEPPEKACVPVWNNEQDCFMTQNILADAWMPLPAPPVVL
jgi:hypothetical protein